MPNMTFWQLVQILGFTVVMIGVSKLRNSLRDTGGFTRSHDLITSIAIGLCMGGVADAILVPTRFIVFALTAFLVTAVFVNPRDKQYSGMGPLIKCRCPACGHKFEAKQPPDTIPASGIFCPICGIAAEEVEG